MSEVVDRNDRVANPRILGLYALAGAAFVIGTHMAGWYGTASSGRIIAPFVMIFGAVQLMAAMWAYERRQEVATAILGVWGAFWLGYGILHLPFASAPAMAGASSELAFWLIVLAATTWIGALAASVESWALAIGFFVLAAASTVGAIGEGIGIHGFELAAGWLFALAGLVIWYTATGMMLEAAMGDEMLPLGRVRVVVPPAEAARRPVMARRVS